MEMPQSRRCGGHKCKDEAEGFLPWKELAVRKLTVGCAKTIRTIRDRLHRKRGRKKARKKARKNLRKTVQTALSPPAERAWLAPHGIVRRRPAHAPQVWMNFSSG